MSKVTKDVMIGFPAYDNRTECDIAQELYEAVSDPSCPVGKVQYYNGDSLVTRARNKVAKMFLDSEFKYLMFIDSDIKFHRSHIARLRSHNKPIVGGVYLKKTLPYQPVMNAELGEEDGLKVMREIGTGFMMIRRDVFGALAFWYDIAYKPDDDEPQGGNYFDFFQVGRKPGQDRYLSEDYYFCQMAADLGIKTYLDASIIVEHWGKMKYPMPDGMLVDGAALLMKQWHPDFPVDEKMSEKILSLKQATDDMVVSRNLKAQQPGKIHTSLEDLFKASTSTADELSSESGTIGSAEAPSEQDGPGVQAGAEPASVGDPE